MIGARWLAGVQQRLTGAIADAARLVAATAQAQAPVAGGQLRASITAQEGRVIASTPYALGVELQQPFLRPALLAERDNITRMIAEAIDE